MVALPPRGHGPLIAPLGDRMVAKLHLVATAKRQAAGLSKEGRDESLQDFQVRLSPLSIRVIF